MAKKAGFPTCSELQKKRTAWHTVLKFLSSQDWYSNKVISQSPSTSHYKRWCGDTVLSAWCHVRDSVSKLDCILSRRLCMTKAVMHAIQHGNKPAVREKKINKIKKNAYIIYECMTKSSLWFKARLHDKIPLAHNKRQSAWLMWYKIACLTRLHSKGKPFVR